MSIELEAHIFFDQFKLIHKWDSIRLKLFKDGSLALSALGVWVIVKLWVLIDHSPKISNYWELLHQFQRGRVHASLLSNFGKMHCHQMSPVSIPKALAKPPVIVFKRPNSSLGISTNSFSDLLSHNQMLMITVRLLSWFLLDILYSCLGIACSYLSDSKLKKLHDIIVSFLRQMKKRSDALLLLWCCTFVVHLRAKIFGAGTTSRAQALLRKVEDRKCTLSTPWLLYFTWQSWTQAIPPRIGRRDWTNPSEAPCGCSILSHANSLSTAPWSDTPWESVVIQNSGGCWVYCAAG